MSVAPFPTIPYDMYESPQEVIIVLPLGGVKKDSLEVKIEEYRILIRGEREKPTIKESFLPIQEECYR
jgi:HSP20 family molecular chaperone IbpA